MIKSLRPYQTALIEDCLTALRAHKRVCLQLATGAGKTIIAGDIMRRLIEKGRSIGQERRALILVHRHELIDQFLETLRLYGLEAEGGVIAAGYPAHPERLFQVASVMSLIRRMQHRPEAHLIIIDEARHARGATWERILEAYPRTWRLGLDATPCRLDGQGLDTIFRAIVPGPSVKSLIRAGALCPVDCIAAPCGLDLKGIRKQAGDYARGELARLITDELADHNAQAIMAMAGRRKTLFFGITRLHAELVGSRLRRGGLVVRYIDGNTPKEERRRSVADFRAGRIDVMLNVEVFLEGVDLPGCDCIFLGAPTLSISRYLQMIGRAMRPGEGKRALVIDAVGNVEMHGLPDADRDWTLDGVGDPELEDEEIKPRECKKCHHLFIPPPISALRERPDADLFGSVAQIQQDFKQAARQRAQCPYCGGVEEIVMPARKQMPAARRIPEINIALARAYGVFRDTEDIEASLAEIEYYAATHHHQAYWTRQVQGIARKELEKKAREAAAAG